VLFLEFLVVFIIDLLKFLVKNLIKI